MGYFITNIPNGPAVERKVQVQRLKPTVVRFFTEGGHDAGTGIYKDTPGVDVLITDRGRLFTLLVEDRFTSPYRLRAPFIGAKLNDSETRKTLDEILEA